MNDEQAEAIDLGKKAHEKAREHYLTTLYQKVMWAARDERNADEETKDFAERQFENPAVREPFRKGAAWQRKKIRGGVWDWQEQNAVLDDAINYFLERQEMNNPKDWEHVVRKLEGSMAAYPSMRHQFFEALSIVKSWALLEQAQKNNLGVSE